MTKALIITDPFNPNLSLEIKQMFYNQEVEIEQICFNEIFNSEFFQKSYLLKLDDESLFNFKEIAKILSQFIIEKEYKYVCCSSTQYAKNLIARTGVLTNSGLVADVINFEIKDNIIDLNRPIYSNKMLATIRCKTDISMFSVIKGIYPANKTKELGRVEEVYCKIPYLKYNIIDKPNNYKLTDSNFIIAAGMGAKDSLKNLNQLEQLINIKVGATKKLVDNNYITYEHQVGISGKIVHPKIYIALGVEGFIHHILGMDKSDLIISVNTNPKAAINKIADIVIIGDANIFSKKLLSKITKEIENK